THIEITAVERAPIERSEVVNHTQTGIQFQITVSKVGIEIDGAISGREINNAGAIGGESRAALPDAAARPVSSDIQHCRLLQSTRVVSHHPTVIGPTVAVRSPGYIHDAIRQQQSRTLVLIHRLETDVPRAIAAG